MSSLVKKFSNRVLPILLGASTAFAAAASAAPVIEPSKTDLSKPLADACVKTTEGQPGLSAWDKLKTVMGARGQMIAANGNKLGLNKVGGKAEMMYTVANNFSGKEGYIIISDTPKGQRETSKGFCFSNVKYAFANNPNNGVPKIINEGEMGTALGNLHKAGSKVAVYGMYSTGQLFAVHFDNATGKGSEMMADGKGMKAFHAAYLNDFEFTDKMKKVFEAELAEATTPVRVAAATAPKPAP